ncbi:transposase [Candidatus Riflebacteria bacterium]
MDGQSGVYRPRNTKESGWYKCVEDNFDEFVRHYDELFAAKFGFWRHHIEKVIYRFLDCGDLKQGFARIRCGDCGEEFLVAFSCKCRHFCPSCHAKRVVEFGEFLVTEVLAQVPHRHVVLSLPKFIRRYFLYDRKLLGKLSRCGWETLKLYLETACPGGSVPGAVVAIQTFGDLLAFHPHLHILVTDGCFQREADFIRAPFFDRTRLEHLFMRKVFSMLLSEGLLTNELIEMHSKWRHSGFHVFCGQPVTAEDETSRENLARYIVRASLSQERLTYLEQEDKVVYKAKDGSAEKEFSSLEWLANICSHIPNPGEHMVRYYGILQ